MKNKNSKLSIWCNYSKLVQVWKNIGRWLKIEVKLIKSDTDVIKHIADIASICYGKNESQNANKLLEKLYYNGHHSCFEHCSFTWRIDGLSRSASHQLVRHRLASYTQQSQRYCNENQFEFVTPDSVRKNPVAFSMYIDLMKEIQNTYNKLNKLGIKKEDSRFILPNACCTSLYMTCNLREFINICNERLCNHAQWEIREMVRKMVNTLPDNLKWMCQPKCESGFKICNNECRK